MGTWPDGFYVAGLWEDYQRVRAVQQWLVGEVGFTLTYDWTQQARTEAPSLESLKAASLDDLDGIRRADILVVVYWDHDLPYKGVWVEVGAALARDKAVWIVSREPWRPDVNKKSSMFLAHPLVCELTIPDSLAQILDSLEVVSDQTR